MPTCNGCKHRTGIPGDAHISCGRAFNAANNPLAGVLAILGGVGRANPPGPTEEINFRPVTTSWPGGGSWPSSFDENIVASCEGHAVKERA